MFSFDPDESSLSLYDELGPAYYGLIDATMVIDALTAMSGKHVTVRLNTPGGSVDEGIAIYNALKRHKGGVTTIVDSLAASMGSYLLQAGERRLVASNAMVMVHNPWTIALGDSVELRKTADVLDKYRGRMLPDFATRSGKTEDEISAIMNDETWYAGKEAVDAGFADEVGIESNVEPMLAGLRSLAKHIPESLIKRHVAAEAVRQKFPKREALKRYGRSTNDAKEDAKKLDPIVRDAYAPVSRPATTESIV